MHRDAAGFGITELVTHSERGGCAFGDDKVGFPQPGCVLLIDALVAVCLAFVFAQGKVPDVFGQDNVIPLNISNNALVKLCILTTAAYRAGEIDFLFHNPNLGKDCLFCKSDKRKLDLHIFKFALYVKYAYLCNMKPTASSRQAIVAEQIKEALAERGLSKKQFAELMGKSPSEVSRWLSGQHNFTIAMLQEISDALGIEITGVEDVRTLVEGYGSPALNEPLVAYGTPSCLYNKIRHRSMQLGLSAKQYIERLVDEDLRSSGVLPAVDLSGLNCPSVEKYAGIMPVRPSSSELEVDERLLRIWKR